MFVSHKLRCVYMPPPRTGTTSIFHALEAIGGQPFVWRSDTWPFCEQNGLKHICHLPKELENYYVFASVRNPYTRQISRFLENWSQDREPTQNDFVKYTFGEKTSQKLSCCGWLNLLPDYIPPPTCVSFKIHHFVRLENIEEDFHALPFVDKRIAFPCKNKCKHEVRLKYDDQMQQHLFRVMKCDFEVFGYKPILTML